MEALNRAPAIAGVDDVDGVVLAVGAGDAEEQREPPPKPQLALLGELASEDEPPAELLVVDPTRLRHAVHEHLEGPFDMRRQLDLAAVFELTC